MPIISCGSKIRSAARRFGAAQDGNIAVVFAFATIPVLAFIGAALDYGRANAARSSMQAHSIPRH
jgi:Flp pilus assembly protein TadG